MVQSYPAPHAQPKKRRPWLLIIGALIMILSAALGALGLFLGISPAAELTDEQPITGSTVINLEEGESTNVWSESVATSCTVTGPDGAPVSDSGTGTQTISLNDTSLHRVMKIEASAGGDHTVSCSNPFVLGEGISPAWLAMGPIGGLGCCLGLVLTIIGFVLWLVNRNKQTA